MPVLGQKKLMVRSRTMSIFAVSHTLSDHLFDHSTSFSMFSSSVHLSVAADFLTAAKSWLHGREECSASCLKSGEFGD